MKPAVEAAIAELRAGLPEHAVRTKEDPDGGAFVIVEGVGIGRCFAPTHSWIGFQITWTCPDADVYPHFIDPGVQYVGSGLCEIQHPQGNLPKAMGRGATMPGFELPAVQVSRRSLHRSAEADSALQKLLRVVAFLESR
jgi:hypothetical protein